MQSQALGSLRQKYSKQKRAEARQRAVRAFRNQTLIKILPLMSQSLVKFHQVLATDICNHKQEIVSTIVNERFQNLSEEDYQELLKDILYLVSQRDIKFPHLNFLPEDPYLVPEMIAAYYRSFDPQTVEKWIHAMDLDDRLLVYLSILDDEEWAYVRKQVIAHAIDDLEHQEALELIEVCLQKGIKIKEIVPGCTQKLIEALVKLPELSLSHLKVVYYVCLRKTEENYFPILRNEMLSNIGKLKLQSDHQENQFQAILTKLKKLQPKPKAMHS